MRAKPPAERVSLVEKVSYGLGDLSASLAWNAAAAFTLFFYTDVALLPAAAIGTLFLFTRIFDAGFDIAIGLAVDRTRTRWGQARPYLLFAAIPFGVLTFLTFVTPDASQDVRLIYAGVTYFLLGLLLSVTNIPFSAMLPMMTADLKEKLDLSAARSVGTSVGVILVTAAFMPAVAALGDGDQRKGFFLTALIVGIVSSAMLLVTFANCKERHTVRPESKGVVSDVSAMFSNQAWLSVAGFATLNFVRFGAILALTPYFAINVLGQPWMISVLMPTLSGTLLLGAFFAPPILRRLGMRRGNTIALLIAAALYVALPFCADAPWTFIAVYVVASLSLSITMTATYAMASDSVDYHQWRFGVRNEGLLAAGVAFAIKVGMAIGTAGVAYGLAAANYDPRNVTPQAREMMSWLYYGIPLVVFALQIACMQFYPVDKHRNEIAAAAKGAHA
ncbi:MAG: MFS transporter [Hyphomonadaceae bacterium]|nr:MFS transporter [Hyphomonadaceae bacterium]